MEFWSELREQVKQNKLGTGVTTRTFSKIRSIPIGESAIVKPAFYFGQLYTLCLDTIEFVENLLSTDPKNKRETVNGILYVREVGRSLLSHVKALAIPLENLILDLNDRYEEEKNGKDEDFFSDEEEKEEFAANEAELVEKMRLHLGNAGCRAQIPENLSAAIGGIYRECVHFAESTSELLTAKDGDLETILGILLDIQYGLEWQMRFLVEDDVSTENGFVYSPGLLTWSALALNDLFPLLEKVEEKV